MADGTLFGRGDRLTVIDLFCGAGGFSLGAQWALGHSPTAAVNHDAHAILLHTRNHPGTIHFQEDVFHVEPWKAARGRRIDLLIGSPDCTHFSVAKGGKPVDSGRRSLAEVFIKWAKEIRPRVIILENVREFTTWGPLDATCRPIPERKGEYFRRWVLALESEGYTVEWRFLRACDFGAPTSRLRLFVVARLDGRPRWPVPSHGTGLLPYRTAAECIDWTLPTRSIFGRERPLAEATMRRIAEGIRRFVVEDPRPFLLQLSHGGRLEPLNEPMKTVTAGPAGGDRMVVIPHLSKFCGASVSDPMPTVTEQGGRIGLVAAFLAKHYTGAIGSRLAEPMHTITTQDHHSLVIAFMVKYYGTEDGAEPITAPLDTVTCRDRFGLVTVHIQGEPWVIVDIHIRMLAPRELARAQGFPDSFILEGTKSDQIARIGNSVCPPVAEALIRANMGPP